jgi:eukaryotic-like serine/threonine-protein kinase
MLAALNGKPMLNFPPPPEARPQAPTGDKVPDVVGRQLDEARSILTKAGFRVSVTQVDNKAPKNVVVGQSPGGGARAAKGTTVTLQVSKGGKGGGKADATVPGVVGQRQRDATAAVRRAGLNPQVVYAIAQDGADVGRVMRQSPGGGSHVPRGSTVFLVIGRRIGF